MRFLPEKRTLASSLVMGAIAVACSAPKVTAPPNVLKALGSGGSAHTGGSTSVPPLETGGAGGGGGTSDASTDAGDASTDAGDAASVENGDARSAGGASDDGSVRDSGKTD